jgi:hypothetical protein
MQNYDINWIMERLGTEATRDEAEAALERAEEWYNTASKANVLAWYAGYRDSNPHAEEIDLEDGGLAENWNEIVMFNRAVADA